MVVTIGRRTHEKDAGVTLMSEAADQSAEPLMEWDVPGLGAVGSLQLSVKPGQALVLVGANGSGKSALSYWMSVNRGTYPAHITRVIAHRRIWLTSSGSEMTTSQRTQNEANFAVFDSQAASRTIVQMDEQRSAKVLYDLSARVNSRNAKAAQRYDLGQVASDDDDIEENILFKIARIFKLANLALSFQVTDNGGFDAVDATSEAYPISQMSDGEKSAFLLAAEVLLSPPRSVLLIDEPERHLHRSISSDLIVAIVQERPDCGFVLLTHDLDLIGKLDPASTSVCTVADVSWADSDPTGWNLRLEPGLPDVPDSVRHAILGGRTKLLFVEGEVSSLDFPLYRLLFPERSVVPCGGSDEVKRAVSGLAGAAAFHWVDGRGALDGDARSADEVAAMAAKGILVLPVNEVENLYFFSWIVKAVADHQAATLGEDAALMARDASARALASLKPFNIQYLASEKAAKILRQEAMAALPTAEDLVTGGSTVTVNLTSAYEAQKQDLESCISGGDYDRVVERFSIRSSAFITAVAQALRFQNHMDYEKAVRTRLGSTPKLLAKLQAKIGELPT